MKVHAAPRHGYFGPGIPDGVKITRFFKIIEEYFSSELQRISMSYATRVVLIGTGHIALLGSEYY